MSRSDVCPPVRYEKQGRTSRVTTLGAIALFGLAVVLAGCNILGNQTPGQNGTALTVSGTMPSGARVGTAINSVLSVNGGSSPYTFSVVAGTLPPGVTLSANSGTISGTPTKSGTYSFEVQVADNNGGTGTRTFQITISSSTAVGVTINPSSATVASAKAEQFTAIVSNTPNVGVTWSASSGTITVNGLYTAPKVSANTTTTVIAKSAADPTKSATATVTITAVSQPPAFSVTTTSLPAATSGSAYSDTLQASGGKTPYKWSISSGYLPSGLSLQSSGSISGATTQTGSFSVTIEATDASSPQQVATKALTLTVSNAVSNGPVVPKTFFGADFNGAKVWPPTDGDGEVANLGGIRLWDDAVKWGQINTADGVYDWSGLDKWLDRASGQNMDVLYTFGDTPQFATQGPPPGMCLTPSGYSCMVPSDVNADGTGSDAYFSNFVTAIVTHAAGRIAYYELWNEPDCTCFFNGTTAQLVRMSKDASAIIRALDPNAKILSPSYHQYSMTTKFDDYVAQGGAAYFDIVNVHMRGLKTDNASPEYFLDVYGTVQSELASRNLTSLPVWDDEHGILEGQGLADPDELAGYVARSAILRAGVGLQRQYVYTWDSAPPYGLQGNQSGTAWNEVAKWLIGHSISACTASGTIYTCQVDNGQIVWDSAQSCSGGACTTSKYTYPTKYNSYRSMSNSKANSLTGSTVQVGYKPIFLTNQ